MRQGSKGWRATSRAGLVAAAALIAAAGCTKTETPTTTGSPAGSTAAPAATGPTGTTDTVAGGSDGTGAPGSSAPGTTQRKSSDTTTKKPSSTTTTSRSSSSDDDEAIAEAALLTDADMPAGFTSTKVSSSNDPSPFLSTAECASYEETISDSEATRTAKAKGKWAKGTEGAITNTVELYEDDAIVADMHAVLDDAGFGTCFEAAFRNALEADMPAGASVDGITFTPITVGDADDLGVDAISAFQVDLTLTGDGKTQSLAFAMVVISAGRMTTQIDLESIPFDALDPLVRTAAANLVANAPS